MRVDKLYEGQVFKNYRVMCEELEMPIRAGNSKKAQLRELDRYCKLQIVGHNITVLELFDSPLKLQEKRGRKKVYGDLMQLLIADYLIESKRSTVLITRNRMLTNISAINKNYTYGAQNIPELSQYAEVGMGAIYDFYNTSNSNFRAAFESALENLRKQSLIMYETVTVVCVNKTHFIADEERKEEILKIERRILKELGYNDLPSVRTSSSWGDFREMVSDTLHEETDIEFYYTSYNITVNRKHIEEGLHIMLEDTFNEFNRESKKDEFNVTIYNKILENAQNRRKKSLEKEFDEKGKMYRVREGFSYISQNKKLADLLIDSQAKSIIPPIEKIKLDKKRAKRNKDSKNK